jgi:hypothetical protein
MTLRQIWQRLRTPVLIGPYHELKRPKFQVDENLERQADAARIAMGDAYLCAVPIRKRLVLDNPDTFVRPPAIEEGELPIG